MEHAGQHVARDEDVRHHVDLPYALPIAVIRLWTAANCDARVRTEKVDLTMRRLDLFHHPLDVSLA